MISGAQLDLTNIVQSCNLSAPVSYCTTNLQCLLVRFEAFGLSAKGRIDFPNAVED